MGHGEAWQLCTKDATSDFTSIDMNLHKYMYCILQWVQQLDVGGILWRSKCIPLFAPIEAPCLSSCVSVVALQKIDKKSHGTRTWDPCRTSQLIPRRVQIYPLPFQIDCSIHNWLYRLYILHLLVRQNLPKFDIQQLRFLYLALRVFIKRLRDSKSGKLRMDNFSTHNKTHGQVLPALRQSNSNNKPPKHPLQIKRGQLSTILVATFPWCARSWYKRFPPQKKCYTFVLTTSTCVKRKMVQKTNTTYKARNQFQDKLKLK